LINVVAEFQLTLELHFVPREKCGDNRERVGANYHQTRARSPRATRSCHVGNIARPQHNRQGILIVYLAGVVLSISVSSVIRR
jgi:hypothetical protein